MKDSPQEFLDKVYDSLHAKYYSYKTEQAYVDWIKSFILFHKRRHPLEMGEEETRTFITYLATERKVLSYTQNQALSAIMFLHRYVPKKFKGYKDGSERL